MDVRYSGSYRRAARKQPGGVGREASPRQIAKFEWLVLRLFEGNLPRNSNSGMVL